MHRPTFNPAVGGSGQGGGRRHAPSQQISVKDILGDASMKKRHFETTVVEDKAALRRQLDEKESEAKQKKGKHEEPIKLEAPAVPDLSEQQKALVWLQQHNPDADAGDDSDDSSKSSAASDDDDDDDDDDEAELLRELEKIKRERAEEAERKQLAEQEAQNHERTMAALTSNPLLATGGGGGNQAVTKKWFEDTVFRNQAAKVKTEKKRFINSTLHSDFHRSFLDRFIK